MTIPGDAVEWDLLRSAIIELQELPHITNLNKLLVEALKKLQSLLLKYSFESWKSEGEKTGLKKFQDALQKALSLATKWKRSRLRILLFKSSFADELSKTVEDIRSSFLRLQLKSKHTEAAKAIGEQLDRVIQGLRDGIELTLAETEFKEKLLDFLRGNQSESETSEGAISISSWLAEHLGAEVDSIRLELQEIKENADSMLHAEQNVDNELLEQLLLSLAVIEEKTANESIILAEVKTKLKCGLCGCVMICPVRVDSGLSFCKPCIEEWFIRGYLSCPVTKREITKHFVINASLQNVISCFGEAEAQPTADSSTEEGESSDANHESVVSDESLEKKAQIGVEYLISTNKPEVLTGFDHLIKCASSPAGRPAVFNANYIQLPPAPPVKVIPTALELAKTQDPEYCRRAMKLMAALTSVQGAGTDSAITLEVAKGLDVLVSLMKEDRLTKTRFLAAETVANILVNKQVRETVQNYDGIVPALVAFSNVDPATVSPKDAALLKRADAACLKGLQRLAKCSKRGDKTQMIVAALLGLLRRGLNYQPELTSLVKDSLIALENQVLELVRSESKTGSTSNATSTNEVCKVIWKDMSDLMGTKKLDVHATVPGRLAIVSIMTKLCDLYKENNTYLSLFLLKMMKGTRAEIEQLLKMMKGTGAEVEQHLAPSPPLPQKGNVEKQLKNLKELLGCSVRLLVTHGKDTAQSVLREHVEEQKSLMEMVDGDNSGILDESRLEILSILNQITVVDRIRILVKLSKSEDQSCRRQVASKLRMFVAGKPHLKKFKEEGGIEALMTLLRDPNPNCQQDALIAVQDLSLSSVIPVDQLPFQTILDFLDEEWPVAERNAAVGLLALMVKEKAVSADMFLKTKGALEAALNLLKKHPDSTGSENSAFVLLEMAKEDPRVRRRIAEPDMCGLDILVNYVSDHAEDPSRIKTKELLTATLVLLCGSGECCQDSVIRAKGHVFLLSSLQEKVSQVKAAQGLLELIKNIKTREQVLEAGFVTKAIASINAGFACTYIALGLALISSAPEGQNQIYLDSLSVSALLKLLKNCPDPEGKDAAASVIARLYPLNRQEDVERQETIKEASELLCRYLDPSNISNCKAFLEALAVIATESKGRKWIHEHDHQHFLIDNLESVTQTDIQDLLLEILAKMSFDISDNGRDARNYIRPVYLGSGIADKLFNLFKQDEFYSRTESVKYALILIRNLSLVGSDACKDLIKQGVVTQLLKVLKRHENSVSVVTELAVKALEEFLNDPNGRQVFIKEGGIKSLAAVLKLDATGRIGDATYFTTIMLIAVAKDPQIREAACEQIHKCDILKALNEIIFAERDFRESSKIRWQAGVVMKLLVLYGPTKHVCSAMNDKGCLYALIQLRDMEHCDKIANEVLTILRQNSRVCKKGSMNFCPHKFEPSLEYSM